MDNVDSYLVELNRNISKKCTGFQPPIFTVQQSLRSIDDLFEDTPASKGTKSWLESKLGDSSDVIFSTTVNYTKRVIELTNIRTGNETDVLLSDTGKVMTMLLEGNENELSVAVSRFLELNGYDGDIADGRSIFYEVYHSIYAIRVLISNMSGYKIVAGDSGSVCIPIKCDSNSISIFQKLLNSDTPSSSNKNAKKIKNGIPGKTAGADSDEEVGSGEDERKTIKKSKRKRSKK